MVGILLYLAASAAAFAIGAQLLRSLKLLPEDRALRALVAVVTGYVAVALLILALGLLGKLQWWALTDLLILCALAGLREIQDGVLTAVAFTRKAARALGSSPWRWVYGVLALIVLAQLFAALAPAGGTDYDGIAEHLAQAKEYARAGRIHPLWYDHHSQFPATVEMWYTLAHVLGQPRGAKLFHWGFGVIALLATMLAGRRLLGPGAGAYGALALATTPNFAWLMGVAYVDLATVACSVLAVYAFCRWLRRVDAEGMRSVGEEEGDTASRAGKPDLRAAGLVGGESSAGEEGGDTASRAGKPDLRTAGLVGGESSAGEEGGDTASRAGKPDLRTAGLAGGESSAGEEGGDTASRAGKPDLRTAGIVGGESSAGEAVQGRKNAYLWLSALMVGAAAGTKMQGLALMGVLAVGVLLSGGIRVWRRGRTASRAGKPDLRTAGIAGGESSAGEEGGDTASRAGKPDLRAAGRAGGQSSAGEEAADKASRAGKPDLRAASIAGGQSSAGEEAADKASRAGKPDLRTAGLAGSRSWAGEDTQDHDAEGKPSAGEQGADTASRARTADLRAAVLGSLAYLAIALAVCWPWYVKSYLWTGNPVYPFAYNIFGGKMWSADRAAGYRRSQLEFGMGELPSEQALQRMSPLRRRFCGPRSPLNLLLAPVNLTLHPTEFTVPLTPFGVCAMSSIGPLYLALLPLLLVVKRRRAIGWLLLIFAPLWAWWLMSMQLTRYLLPSLALICPAVGWAVAEAERKGGLLGAVTRAATGVWAVVALALTMLYVLPQTPVALGLQSEYGYLMQTLPVYQPCVYINRHTPEDAKIALYGEPRGYYLDRDYLWAERGHSALIRYEDVRTPEDLMSEYPARHHASHDKHGAIRGPVAKRRPAGAAHRAGD